MAPKKAAKPATKTTARPKRPRDVNQLAHFLVQATTEREVDMPKTPAVSTSEISRVMAELGRRGGKVGGVKRAVSLTPERRREIALKAARSRWDKTQTSENA